MANQLRFYAVVIPGLEKIAEQELLQLSGHHVEVVHGGVRFSGTYDTMYRVNLRARSITRVQLSLARKNAMNTKELESILTSIAWERFLYANQPLRFHITSVQSRLMHTGKIEDAVRKHLVNYPLPASTHELSEQKIYVYIKNNRCHIRMDTSGERLDRRGYRLESGKAPIRETIAAGLLKWMEWNASTPLVVPMCGSGTFAIEAAQMAQHIINARDYACLQWPSCKEKVWNDVKARSQQMQKDIPLCIEASDHHAGAVEIAIHNAKRAQVLDKMLVQQIALKDLIPNTASGAHGLIVCNPPYGSRIADETRIYHQLGHVLREQFSGCRALVLSPDQASTKALGLSIHRHIRIVHGGTPVEALDIMVP